MAYLRRITLDDDPPAVELPVVPWQAWPEPTCSSRGGRCPVLEALRPVAVPPSPDAPRAMWARFYTEAHGLALVPIPAGEKGPTHHGWNKPRGFTTDPAKAESRWRLHPLDNMGALHSASGTATLDLDHAAAPEVLRLVGVDVTALLDQAGAVSVGNPDRLGKPWYRVPPEVALEPRKLTWPSPEPGGKPVCVFELRAGPVQDVLPPSLHPCGSAYRWALFRGFDPLPEALLDLWRRWDDLLPAMQAACPWAEPEGTARATGPSEADWAAVRAEVLRRYSLAEALTEAGITLGRNGKAPCPFHDEKTPSFWTWTADGIGHWCCGHGGAPAGRATRKGHSVGDALDLYAWHHGLSVGRATAELAERLGVALPGCPDRDHAAAPRVEAAPSGASGASGTGGECEPDLGVLHSYRRPAPPFPLDLLGRWEPWCAAAAEGAGAPVDYVACALFAVAAGAVGNAARVSPWPGWVEPSVLWVGLVGAPSSGKSPATDPPHEAVARLERRWAEPFEAEHKAWEVSAAVAKATQAAWEKAVADALKRGKEPPDRPDLDLEPEPQRPRLRVSDATPEAVETLMVANPRGLLLTRDELSAWLGSFGRYSGAGAGERGGWLEAYGARQHLCDRVTAGRSATIPRYAVSILGTIQPARLDRLLLAGDDDGLPSRFLWCWPEPLPPRRPRRCADVGELELALEWLRSLPMPADENGDLEPLLLRLSPEAADLLDAWRTEHDRASRGCGGMMASAAGKAPGAVLRLALVLELLEAAGTAAPVPGEVSAAALARGIALWVDYFSPMAERVLGDAALPEADRDAAALARWVAATRPATVNARELRRRVRLPGLTSADRARAALDGLVEAGWFDAPSRGPETGGRPRADYRVRPELLEALGRAGGAP